jgi:hypothetical protein
MTNKEINARLQNIHNLKNMILLAYTGGLSTNRIILKELTEFLDELHMETSALYNTEDSDLTPP